MPVFNVHIQKNTFTDQEKRGLADALTLALHEAMNTPLEDQFIFINEHEPNEFYIHPTFPDMNRTEKKLMVTVTFGDTRTLEQKRALAELVTRYAVEKAGVGPDDVSMIMYALPVENMTFGRGTLVTDTELAMPWVEQKE